MTKTDFDLQNFFPYQVRIYYRAVTDAIASVYKSKYDLSVSEWRVMAVLGANEVLSASEIVARSSLTKVNVSRAVKNLHAKNLLKRDINGDDKRFAALRLTDEGNGVLETLLPLVIELEQQMFANFSEAEIASLRSMMERVRSNIEAQAVEHQDAAPE